MEELRNELDDHIDMLEAAYTLMKLRYGQNWEPTQRERDINALAIINDRPLPVPAPPSETSPDSSQSTCVSGTPATEGSSLSRPRSESGSTNKGKNGQATTAPPKAAKRLVLTNNKPNGVKKNTSPKSTSTANNRKSASPKTTTAANGTGAAKGPKIRIPRAARGKSTRAETSAAGALNGESEPTESSHVESSTAHAHDTTHESTASSHVESSTSIAHNTVQEPTVASQAENTTAQAQSGRNGPVAPAQTETPEPSSASNSKSKSATGRLGGAKEDNHMDNFLKRLGINKNQGKE